MKTIATLLAGILIALSATAQSTVNITSICSLLDLEVCTFLDDNGELMVIEPGETITGISDLSLPANASIASITDATLRKFQVEGYVQYSYAWIEDEGLYSALGNDPDDFDVSNPELVKITLDTITLENGDNIRLTIMSDLLTTGERVSWVLGDLDDSNDDDDDRRAVVKKATSHAVFRK